VGAAYSWAELRMSNNFGAGILTNGQLLAWGENSIGQVGVNNRINQPYPSAVGGSLLFQNNGFSLALGNSFALAIRGNGQLYAWGYNGSGQLGTLDQINYSSPIMISSAQNWYSVAAGQETSYGIKTDGTLWAWGYGTNGQIGNGTVNTYISIQPTATGLTMVLPTATQTTLSSWYHTLAIINVGGGNTSLYSWGTGWSGALGNNKTTQAETPQFVGASYVKVAAGNGFSAAIRNNGTLWTWGYNAAGQLGQNNMINRSSPVQVPGSWSNVACGAEWIIAQRSDGTLWNWGNNFYDILGDANAIAFSSPVQVQTNWTNWQSLTASTLQLGAK
jgi:alpha-tubulin suppressor-like RCC1 family protein